MPKKGITGHDGWVMTKALATALVALEQLPPKHQPHTQMDDIRKLLAAGCQRGSLSGLSVLEAVFSLDDRAFKIGQQPALCLGERQVHRPELTTCSQKLLE